MKLPLFTKPILWLALICYGLFLPVKNLPVKSFLQIPYFDKIVHFGLFFMFCLLLFNPFKQLKMKYYFWAPFIAILFGVFLESIQQTISVSRSSSLTDLLVNIFGIIAAIIFFRYFISGKKWEKLF